jgi:hypothetical protein
LDSPALSGALSESFRAPNGSGVAQRVLQRSCSRRECRAIVELRFEDDVVGEPQRGNGGGRRRVLANDENDDEGRGEAAQPLQSRRHGRARDVARGRQQCAGAGHGGFHVLDARAAGNVRRERAAKANELPALCPRRDEDDDRSRAAHLPLRRPTRIFRN